jgi:hypothetical protein
MCGKTTNLPPRQDVTLCGDHVVQDQAPFSVLLKAAVQIQRAFLHSQRRRRIKKGLRFPVISSFSAAATRRLQDCIVAKKQCERSIYFNFDRVYKNMLLGKNKETPLLAILSSNASLDPKCPVVKVEEVKYLTYPRENGLIWWHCVFRLTPRDGTFYAFDPTGIQFGPEWPLIQEWWQYQWKHIQCPKPTIEPFGSKITKLERLRGRTPPVEVAEEAGEEDGYDGEDEYDESWGEKLNLVEPTGWDV